MGVNQKERRLVYEGKKAKTKGGMTKADIVLDKGVYKSRKQMARGKALSSTYGPPTKEQSAKGRAKAKQVRASGGKSKGKTRSGRKPGTDCHLLSKRGRAACERAAKRAQKTIGSGESGSGALTLASLGVPVAPAAPQYKAGKGVKYKVRSSQVPLAPAAPTGKVRGGKWTAQLGDVEKLREREHKVLMDEQALLKKKRGVFQQYKDDPRNAPPMTVINAVLRELEREPEYKKQSPKEKKKMEVATTLLAASDRPSDTEGLLAAVEAAVEAQPLADNTSIFAKVANAPIAAIGYILDTGTEDPMFDDPERAAAARKYDARTALEEKEVQRISMKIDGFQREAKRAMERGDPDAHNRASRKRDAFINKLRSKYGVEYKWE